MNLIEGLKRIGIVAGAFFAVAGGTVWLVDNAPTADRLSSGAADEIVEILWGAQSDGFRSSSSKWEMQRQLWPGMGSAEIVIQTCGTKTAKPEIDSAKVQWDKPVEPSASSDKGVIAKDAASRIQFTCLEHSKTAKSVFVAWAVEIAKTVGVALLVGLIWGLLWAAFMWVVSGFIKPKSA